MWSIICKNWGSRSKSTIICRDDLQEAQMAFFWSYTIGKTKASSKIKRLGKSVSQRRTPRETEKAPLTMIDEKSTGARKIKTDMGWWSLRVFKGFRTQTTNWRIFRQDGRGVMNVFFLAEFSRHFLRFRTHVVATTVCTPGRCTYTHLLQAHFSAHGAYTITFAHLSCVSHTRMAQGCQKGSLHMCHISPSRLLQSHVSLILAVPWRSLRDHSWLWRPRVPAELTCPNSAGHAHLRTIAEESGYLAKSALNTATAQWPTNSFTVMSLHINNNATKRGIGKQLLLTIPAIMQEEHVDLVAGDFMRAAWRQSK